MDMIEILTNVEGQNVFNTANKVATDKEDNIDFKKYIMPLNH